ncbi:MAG: AAA family ATPase [Planctomycetes bacterium]|nr:AAA family ATPase [Planctomycetota bacterium]
MASGLPLFDRTPETSDPVQACELQAPWNAPRPLLKSMDEFEETPVSWLWKGIVPQGRVTLLAGDPGVGKSLVTLDLAARVSAGAPFPRSISPRRPAVR